MTMTTNTEDKNSSVTAVYWRDEKTDAMTWDDLKRFGRVERSDINYIFTFCRVLQHSMGSIRSRDALVSIFHKSSQVDSNVSLYNLQVVLS